jgi:hypothetical protein
MVFIFNVCVLSAHFTVSLIPTNLQLSRSYVIDASIHSFTVSNILKIVDQSSQACEATTATGISCTQTQLG